MSYPLGRFVKSVSQTAKRPRTVAREDARRRKAAVHANTPYVLRGFALR